MLLTSLLFVLACIEAPPSFVPPSKGGPQGPADPPALSKMAPRSVALTCPAPDRPLGATLWLPGEGTAEKLPTAVVLVGAQPWTRDGDLPGKPWGHYRDIAETVARRGGAALLFDKGGTGETGGPEADLDQRVREATAAVACAKARAEVDPAKVYLVGHSQGSLVATQAVAGGLDVAELILLSPIIDADMAATIPDKLNVFLLRGALDSEGEDQAVLDKLGTRGRRLIVPGGDHLLFDATLGTPDPNAPTTTISPVAARAVADAVMGVPVKAAQGPAPKR